MKITSYIALIAVFLSVSCASQQKVSVYNRNDVDTTKSKVIAFPMLLWDGKKIKSSNTVYSNQVVDTFIGKNWTDNLGKENIIVIPKLALDKVPGAYTAMNTFIKALDGTSAVEQSTELTNLLTSISSQFGDGAFAMALVTVDKKEYDTSGQVQVNMGLFDTKKLTWKWITKHSYKKGLAPIPYEKVVQDLVSESFEALKAETKGLVR